jgi:hypothetical protein
MFRHGASIISVATALVIVSVATEASAQTNIDQGKSPAEIFANACVVCHKTTRGLANGQNSLTLPSFLREHYTASKDQAAALAAYVLASGGSGPAPQAAQKPSAEHPRTAVEEPRNGEPKAGEPKNGEPKTAAHPLHQTAKREEAPAAAKPDEQKEDEAKPRVEPSPAASSPGPVVGTRETPPAKPGPAQGADSVLPALPPVARAPMPAETPNATPAPDPDLNPAPSTTASGDAQPSDGPPVPRDSIPD